jgi:hypothetical protein
LLPSLSLVDGPRKPVRGRILGGENLEVDDVMCLCFGDSTFAALPGYFSVKILGVALSLFPLLLSGKNVLQKKSLDGIIPHFLNP